MTTDMASASIGAIAKALAQAQSEFPRVAKNCDNPFYRSKYADLDSIIDAVKAPLAKNGLSYTQLPGAYRDGVCQITTILMHTSGEWLRSDLEVPVAKPDPQGVGSAITYARRYALQAICGITAETDDDGNSASVPHQVGGAEKEDGGRKSGSTGDTAAPPRSGASAPAHSSHPTTTAAGEASAGPASTVTIFRSELNEEEGQYGPGMVFTWLKPGGNGKQWKVTIRFFRNKQTAEWYDSIKAAQPSDRLTLKIANVSKNGKTYTNVTGLEAINGAPWPLEGFAPDEDIPF